MAKSKLTKLVTVSSLGQFWELGGVSGPISNVMRMSVDDILYSSDSQSYCVGTQSGESEAEEAPDSEELSDQGYLCPRCR